jgi:hypothetical protein
VAPVRGYSFDEGKCRGSVQLHTHTRLIAAASLGRPPPEYVTPSGSVPIPSAGMVYGPSRTVDGGCGTAPTIPSTRRRFESGAAAEWGTMNWSERWDAWIGPWNRCHPTTRRAVFAGSTTV